MLFSPQRRSLFFSSPVFSYILSVPLHSPVVINIHYLQIIHTLGNALVKRKNYAIALENT